MDDVVFNEDYRLTMPRYPDRYFKWAVCDINYNIGAGKMAFLQNGKDHVKQKNGTIIRTKRTNREHTDWDDQPPPPQEYFDELRRISENQIIFGVDYVKWEGLGPGRIRWDKCVADGVSFSRYEMAIVLRLITNSPSHYCGQA